MSCIIPASLSSSEDLKQIAVNKTGVYPVRVPAPNTPAGYVVKQVPLTPDQRQQQYSRELVAQNKRSVNKYITALFTGTGGGATTALLGDAFAATQYADANGAWTFQNGAAAGANQKTAFNNMIKSQPFKYVGIQIDVNAVAQWTGITWTEVITDYDSTNTYDWKPKVNAGLNTYAQTTTTRFLRVGGEFNGNWALYMTGITNAAASTINFTFNCVDIQRNW